ncbi:MAG: PIN domain-containing protein [Dehalococcoidia bacterium]|nr:PIN domain-containing protein [Dehalococcoidia bacterium]
MVGARLQRRGVRREAADGPAPGSLSVLVDSSVIIDALRGNPSAIEVLVGFRSKDVVHSSVVVKAEVLAGMHSREEQATRSLLEVFEWHGIDEGVAEEAGRLGRLWLPSHGGIDTADLLIAATATVLGLKLVTLNIRHFPMFSGLQRPY